MSSSDDEDAKEANEPYSNEAQKTVHFSTNCREGDMEMTFTPNEVKDGQTTLSRALKQKLEDNMAPWEKYLKKKKDKQKLKRESRKLSRMKTNDPCDSDGVQVEMKKRKKPNELEANGDQTASGELSL